MHDELEQRLLGVEFFFQTLAVDQELPIFTVCNSLLLQDGLHFGEVRSVTRHVCGQNDANEALSESLKVISTEILQEVVLSLVQNCERLGGMVIFLHRLVTVADGSIRYYVDVVNVRESIVSEVVTYSRHAYRKHVHFTEVSEAYHAAVLQELVAHLEDVKGVHVIVILNVAPVSFVDLPNEARQLGLVHLRQLIYAKILEDVERDHRQRRFSAHVATKAQCVEIHVFS